MEQPRLPDYSASFKSTLSNPHKIAWNAVLALTGRVLGSLCHFFTLILIARGLGKAQFGLYAFSMELTFLLCIISDGGMSVVITREIARDKDAAARYVGNALFLRILLSGITFFLILMAGRISDLNIEEMNILLVLGLGNLLLMWGNFTIAIFRAYEKMIYEGILVALQGLSILAFMVFVVYVWRSANNLNVIMIGPVLASGLMVVIGHTIAFGRVVKPHLRVDWALMKLLLKEGAPILIALFLVRAYRTTSIIALEHMRSTVELGLFNVAFRLTDNLQVIPVVVCAALLPTFSRYAMHSRTQLLDICADAFRSLFLIGFPIAIGTTVFAKRIILLLFGEEYANATLSLQILIWAIFCFFLSYVLKTLMEAINRQVLWSYALFVGLCVSLGLNVLLVRSGGVLGASLAILIADSAILGMSLYFVSRGFPIVRLVRFVPRILFSGLIMAVVIFPIRSYNLFLAVPLGALIYGSSLFLVGAMRKEKHLLGNLLRRFHP